MQNTFSFGAVVILLLALAALSFFFSASETAVIGLNKIRLRHMLTKGIKRAQNVQRLVTKLDKLIAAILIGNNLVNVAISAIVTAILVQIFGYRWGAAIATFITAFCLLIFCEITPKILAIKHAEKVALFSAPIMEALIIFLKPLIGLFTAISNFILRIFGIGPAKRSALITEEELRLMIEIGKEEGVLSDEERKMLHRIFEFGDIRVEDVMVPKEKIVAVNADTGAEELLNIFVEQGHARLPVYRDSPENIIGVVYAHDLLYILRDKGLFLLQDILHQPYYVSGKARVSELLKAFQQNKLQIAIVADESKKASGLVTLEDLVEEIIGEVGEERAKRPQKKNK